MTSSVVEQFHEVMTIIDAIQPEDSEVMDNVHYALKGLYLILFNHIDPFKEEGVTE